MSTPLFIVDAFVTDGPFTGNPAAVCVLPPGAVDSSELDSRMQAIAAEMNLSETAFVSPRGEGAMVDAWSIRWFTPGEEVALCGHATIAAVHALRSRGLAPMEAPIRLHTRRRGELVATRIGSLEAVDLPATPLVEVAQVDPVLFEGLGIGPSRVTRTLEEDLVVVLEDPDVIEAMRPDMRALAAIPARGIAVTALSKSSAESDGPRVVSRYFAPGVAVDEDPVTGSLHASLGLLWRETLGPRFLARQASARGGLVRVDARRGDEGIVEVAGDARMVVVGELAV